MSLILLVLLIGATYAILIVPQQRKLKRHEQLVSELVVGDEVITASGIYGTIIQFEGEVDEIIRLEVAPDVVISMLRTAVTEVAVEEAVDDGADDGAED